MSWVALGAFACLSLSIPPAQAAAANAAPDLAKQFAEWQLAAYRQVLAAHREADNQVERTIALCRFIEGFVYSEDIGWIEDAQADLAACREELEELFPAETETLLYLLEDHYGADAVEFGSSLLATSAAWAPFQRARLHAALSHAYNATDEARRAGEHAVLALDFDAATNLVPQAIRHLGTTGSREEAIRLAVSTPAATNPWQAGERVRALVDAGAPDSALAEVGRHRVLGIEIDHRIIARALLANGQRDEAIAVFELGDGLSGWESAPDRLLHFDIALAAGRMDIAARVLGQMHEQDDQFGVLVGSYARLLHYSPAAAFHPDAAVVTAIAAIAVLALLLAPGLFLAPAHYRGLARRLRGRAVTAMFARVGLGQAWLASAAFLIVPLVVAAILVPDVLHLLIDGGVEPRHGDAIGRAGTWGAAVCLVLLWPVWRRFSWTELLGSRAGWRATAGWVIVCVLGLFAVAWLHGVLLQPATPVENEQTRMIEAMAQGLKERGGTWAVILVLAVLTPVLEELVYRGALLGGLTRHISFGWANLLQALLFAAVHADPPRFLYYLSIGLLAGWLARRTGGLLAPILLHGLNNLLFISILFAQ